MDPSVKLCVDQGELLSSPNGYRRLVGKLNYLIITRPNISFAINVISQFMSAPRSTNLEATLRIVRYLKAHLNRVLFYGIHGHLLFKAFTNFDWARSPSNVRSTTGHCTFLGDNLVTWKSKKQMVVARSGTDSEYRVMAHTSCELMWIQHFLEELSFEVTLPMDMYCDNQVVVHIASNPVFNERTKHIEIDCHLVRK